MDKTELLKKLKALSEDTRGNENERKRAYLEKIQLFCFGNAKYWFIFIVEIFAW